jgi:protein-tyrosine phosphatase
MTDTMKKKTEKMSVLFVCTGNIFRSMTAEYVMKKYLKDHKLRNILVSSAGTVANPEPILPALFDGLKKIGIDTSKHKQRRLTSKILNENDVIISMAKYHQDFILENFHKDSFLFNELAVGKNDSVLDVNDVMKDWMTNHDAVNVHVLKTLNYIHSQIPHLVDEIIERNLLFSHFVNGLKKHSDGHPFKPLLETKNCVAFLSTNIPKKEDSHVLVIPRKRYSNLEDVPDNILNELMKCIKIIAKALKLRHPAYNILINVGKSAGQWQNHVHFHIIPRKPSDEIKIEIWKKRKLSNKEFLKYHEQMLSDINKIRKVHKI